MYVMYTRALLKRRPALQSESKSFVLCFFFRLFFSDDVPFHFCSRVFIITIILRVCYLLCRYNVYGVSPWSPRCGPPVPPHRRWRIPYIIAIIPLIIVLEGKKNHDSLKINNDNRCKNIRIARSRYSSILA